MASIRIFGGIRIERNGSDRTPAGRIPLRLLAVLTDCAPNAASVPALIEAGWGDEPPATVQSALRTHLSVVRRALGGGLDSAHRSYVLSEPSSIDLVQYRRLVAEARGTGDDAASRFDALTRALDTWTGRPWGDLADDAGLAHRALMLEELHRGLEDEWGALAGELGPSGGHVDRLWELAIAEPLREQRWVSLVRALHGVGRVGDALRAYEIARTALADQLGIRPGLALSAAHDALFGDHGTLAPRSSRRRIVPQGPIVGRGSELRHVRSCLDDGLPVTLVGIGGMGKSRLAHEVADAAMRRGERVWMLAAPPEELAHRFDRELAAQLGISAPTELDARDALISRLAEVDLLVVDGAEGCGDRAAELVEVVRLHRPRCRLLVTSRQPLAFSGEVTIVVGPLPTPEHGAGWRGTAVELLARSRGVDPDGGSAETFGELLDDCRTTGGIPLLLELAGHGGPALTGVRSDADRVERTALELVGSLESPTRRLVVAMAALPGGVDTGLAGRLVATSQRDADRRLRHLSWLGLARTTTVGRSRVHVMLDPVRDAVLSGSDPRALASVREALVDHLIDVGSRLRPALGEPTNLTVFEEFDSAAVNLRSVLDTRDPRWLRVAAGAADHLGCRGFAGEGAKWIAPALDSADPLERATAALTGARIGRVGGNLVALTGLLEDAVEVFRGVGDTDAAMFASLHAAIGRAFEQRFGAAADLLIAAWPEDGPNSQLSSRLFELAWSCLLMVRGEHAEGLARIEAVAVQLESIDLVAASLAHYLLVASAQVDPPRARRCVPDALRVADSIGDAPMAAAVRMVEASLVDDPSSAVPMLRAAAVGLDAAGMPERAGIARVRVAEMLVGCGSSAEARQDLVGAIGPLERAGSAQAPVAIAMLSNSLRSDDPDLSRRLAAACRALQSSHRSGYASPGVVGPLIDGLLADTVPRSPSRDGDDLPLDELLARVRALAG